MENFLLDLLFVVIGGLVAYAISRTGGVRAAFWFVGTLLVIVVALSLFESLFHLLLRTYVISKSANHWPYGRFVCLLGLFAVGLSLLYLFLRFFLPPNPEPTPAVETTVRWATAALGGYATAAFLLIALHTFPGNEEFGGYFPSDPDDRPGFVMRLAPDHHLLKVMQIATDDTFLIGENGELFPAEYPSIGDDEANGWAAMPARYRRWRAQLDEERMQIERDKAEEEQGEQPDEVQ